MDAKVSSPTNQIKLAPNCTVCTEAVLQGEISIGSGTIVHPRAHIIAEAGPIVIGENNLIEENTYVINRQKPGSAGETVTMTIGNGNVFEVGCKCEARRMGDNNVVEHKALVGPEVEITNGCVIGALCSIQTQETLPEGTIVYGENCLRRSSAERPILQISQIECLRAKLPSYHYLMPTSK